MIKLMTQFEGRKVSVVAAVKRDYATEGWKFLEVVGDLTTDALPVAHFSSMTEQRITATALRNGRRLKKVYVQTDRLFLTVTMQRPTGAGCRDGDTFSLVFSKPKPPPYHPQRTRSRSDRDCNRRIPRAGSPAVARLGR